MTEQELQAIAERLKRVDGLEWRIRAFNGLGLVGPDRDTLAIVDTNREAVKHLIQSAPSDMAALLAEVRFLRGELADLCEDSRAVAEVGRLREVLADVIHNINNGVDAIEKFRPEWKGLRHGLAQLKAIAQRGLKGGGE